MLRDFLDNSAVAYQTAVETKRDLKTSDIAKNARGHTLLISCTAEERRRARRGGGVGKPARSPGAMCWHAVCIIASLTPKPPRAALRRPSR